MITFSRKAVRLHVRQDKFIAKQSTTPNTIIWPWLPEGTQNQISTYIV